MQRRRVRAAALPLGAGGIAEDDGTGNSRFPSGMTTRKALHAADARFARHVAGVALPLVAGGIAEDDGKGNSRFPSGMTTRKARAVGLLTTDC